MSDIATLFNEVQAEIEGQHQQLAVLDHEIGAIEQAVRGGAAARSAGGCNKWLVHLSARPNCKQ